MLDCISSFSYFFKTNHIGQSLARGDPKKFREVLKVVGFSSFNNLLEIHILISWIIEMKKVAKYEKWMFLGNYRLHEQFTGKGRI